MNIVLIGMRGSGKSKIGKELAHLLKYDFIDTDKAIESEEQMTIKEIVEKNDWAYFRKLEKKMCEKVSKAKKAIISTGGGVILDDNNIKNLKENGIVVFLHVSPALLKKRLMSSPKESQRPTLTDTNLLEEIDTIWSERKEKYIQSADITFDIHKDTLSKSEEINTRSKAIIALLKEKSAI